MKIILTILSLIVVLGAVYGLAFLGVIPVQKIAGKNPMLAKVLAQVHLAPPKQKKNFKSAAKPQPSPQAQALQAQEQQIAAERAQLDRDRAAFEAEKQQTSAPSTAAAPPASAPVSGAKLSAIYATMSPDDIAAIFAKLPDPDVIRNLMPLDEKKAGDILAALPPDRAARLSQEMQRSAAPQRTISASPTPRP